MLAVLRVQTFLRFCIYHTCKQLPFNRYIQFLSKCICQKLRLIVTTLLQLALMDWDRNQRINPQTLQCESMPFHDLSCIECCIITLIVILEPRQTLIKWILVFHRRKALYICPCMPRTILTQLRFLISDLAPTPHANWLCRIINHRSALVTHLSSLSPCHIATKRTGRRIYPIHKFIPYSHLTPLTEVPATCTASAPRNYQPSGLPNLHHRR